MPPRDYLTTTSTLDPIEDITRRRILTAIPAIGLMAAGFACGGDDDNDAAATPTESPTGGPSTRTVSTALGEIELPVELERLAVLNVIALDATLRSGMTPVAYYGRPTPSLTDAINDLEYHATFADGLDLERLALLRPELLMDGAYEGALFSGVEPPLLQEIAPVAAFPFESDSQWKEYNRFYADLVGGPDAAGELLRPYEERLAEVRTAIPEGLTVSVSRPRPDRLQNFDRSSFAGSILADLGVATVQLAEGLSLERLSSIDSDAIFVFASEDDPSIARSSLDSLFSTAIWQQLNAVREGRTHSVSASWFGFGVTEALVVLEDIQRTLGNG